MAAGSELMGQRVRHRASLFYIEELEEALRLQFPSLNNISVSTLCRALMHDLGLTRK
ncbi:hypothetical protein DYB38_013253, partial [Aphanomyces astaci]